MATEVIEDTGLALARERAAAILYGNEKLIEPVEQEPVYQSPVLAEYSVPVKDDVITERLKDFSSYITLPEREKQSPTQGFRSYNIPPAEPEFEAPRVIRPYVDANVQNPEYEKPVKAETKSPLDMEMEDDTAYVVRFKAPTLITAAATAVVFVLLVVLFIVNAVNISAANFALQQATAEQAAAAARLDAANAAANDAMTRALENAGAGLTPIPTGALPAEVPAYTAPVDLSTSTNFFDIICKFLSGLFG